VFQSLTDGVTVVRRIAAGAMIIGMAVLSSCTAPTVQPSATSTPSPTQLRPSCSPSNEGTYWTPPGATDDSGAVLTIGSGDQGILLVPQSNGDICQWLVTGRRLAARGYRVAMMNWAQPYGESVTAAYAELRSRGARSILLVGASMGASYALYLAPKLKPVAVASFSADPVPSGVDVESKIIHYPSPVLFVGSEHDMYAPGSLTRHLAGKHPGPEQVLVVKGSEHGVELLVGTYRGRVRAALDGFVAKTCPPKFPSSRHLRL
jgi:pimeloyl-ACP methyl ester carboxylesterase